MKGTPELATGTIQLIFLVNFKGVVRFILTIFHLTYVDLENLVAMKAAILRIDIICGKGIL